jgi:tetratricopeptide (TPR) repeat protein
VASPEQALREAHDAEMNGDLSVAESILRDAVKRWKREPEFKMRHARVLRTMGLEKRALKVYRSVLKTNPQRADAAQAAAETAMALGKAKLAETLWGRALAVGAPTDVATTGLCRAMWLRGRREEAWEQALQSFVQNGRASRPLHEFLIECSPVLGMSVPDLDLLDVSELKEAGGRGPALVRDDAMRTPATFATDSMEAMAGIDAQALLDLSNVQNVDLLSDTIDSAAAVDMSALALPRPSVSARSKDEIPDDLLDFD